MLRHFSYKLFCKLCVLISSTFCLEPNNVNKLMHCSPFRERFINLEFPFCIPIRTMRTFLMIANNCKLSAGHRFNSFHNQQLAFCTTKKKHCQSFRRLETWEFSEKKSKNINRENFRRRTPKRKKNHEISVDKIIKHQDSHIDDAQWFSFYFSSVFTIEMHVHNLH